MQDTPLAKRLVDNWPVGVAIALVLGLLPLVNWLGVALAVLLMLRHGGILPSIGYVLIALASYFALAGYSFNLLGQEWPGILVTYAPLWVMAWLLRGVRSLSLALAGGAFSLMALIGLMWLVKGPPNLEAWMNYFQCRMEATGLTQAQLTQMLPGMSLSEVVRSFMLGWSLSLSLIQVGVLLFARWIQARYYYPGGFRLDFHALRQPKSVAVICGALLLATTFAPESMVTLVNLGMVALVLMGITGLGFVHAYVSQKGYSVWWLVFLYLFLVMSTWAGLMLLAMVALLDSGLNLRMRAR